MALLIFLPENNFPACDCRVGVGMAGSVFAGRLVWACLHSQSERAVIICIQSSNTHRQNGLVFSFRKVSLHENFRAFDSECKLKYFAQINDYLRYNATKAKLLKRDDYSIGLDEHICCL